MGGRPRTMDSLQALYFFFSPCLALRAKSRVCIAWLIKRLLCGLAWMCEHSEAETRLSFICNSTPQSMTSLRLPTSDVIDCGLELHQGFQATPLPVGAKGKMFVHPLWKMFTVGYSSWVTKCLRLVNARDSPHAHTVQRHKETYILQMWWIDLMYGFFLQNPAYFPRIYVWIFYKYSSTSFWQRLLTEFYGEKF